MTQLGNWRPLRSFLTLTLIKFWRLSTDLQQQWRPPLRKQ